MVPEGFCSRGNIDICCATAVYPTRPARRKWRHAGLGIVSVLGTPSRLCAIMMRAASAAGPATYMAFVRQKHFTWGLGGCAARHPDCRLRSSRGRCVVDAGFEVKLTREIIHSSSCFFQPARDRNCVSALNVAGAFKTRFPEADNRVRLNRRTRYRIPPPRTRSLSGPAQASCDAAK